MAILPKLEPPVLPSGYVELEYVEQPLGNSGYFKTGLTPSNTLEFEIGGVTYDTISNTVAQIGCLFGSRTSATYEYQLTTYIDSGATNKGTLRMGTNVIDANLIKNTSFEAYTEGTKYVNNGIEKTIIRDFADASPAEIYVFAFNVADGGTDRVRQNGHGKIKYLRFKNNGEYVRIYVPCKNKADTVGFYDTVNDTFNPSLATAFVGGPIVVRRPLTVGISQKIIDIQVIKEDLRDAITGHYNSDVLDYYDGLVDYADAIDGITGSQRVLPTEPSVVNFIDYDGTLLYAYTAAEFQALDGMPPDPFHSGLVAQGWNWTRAEILDYLNRAPRIDVGQMYITNDGATRYYIHKQNINHLIQPLHFYQGTASGILVNWGDGSSERFSSVGDINTTHTYSSTGDYVISLLPNDNCTFWLTESENRISGQDQTRKTIFGYFTNENFRPDELYKVELGKNVTYIPSCAFCEIHSLEAISIPKRVADFDYDCFRGTHRLKTIIFPKTSSNYIQLRSGAFYYSVGLKYVCTTPKWEETFTGGSTFYYCKQLHYILIPDACSSELYTEAFAYSGLREIYISKNITKLNARTFGYLHLLEKVNLEKIRTFSDGFRDCWSLLKIKIGEGTTAIAANAFSACYSVSEIDLPSTLTSIGATAFSNSYNLRRIIIRATTPPTLSNTNAFKVHSTQSGSDVRYGIGADVPFYVPYSEDHSVLNQYKTTYSTYVNSGSQFYELNSDGTLPS